MFLYLDHDFHFFVKPLEVFLDFFENLHRFFAQDFFFAQSVPQVYFMCTVELTLEYLLSLTKHW